MTMSGEITSPLGQSPIAHVWQVSFKHLESRFPSSVALFNLMVFLDGSWVPEKLISTGLPGIRDEVFAASEETTSNDVAPTGPPWRLDNGLRFNEAIAHLLSFSLIRRLSDERVISVPPLLSTFGKDRLTDVGRSYWAMMAVKVLHSALTSDKYEQEIYVRHADVCIENAEKNFFEIDELSVVRTHGEWGHDLSYMEMCRLSERRSLKTWGGSISSCNGGRKFVPIWSEGAEETRNACSSPFMRC